MLTDPSSFPALETEWRRLSDTVPGARCSTGYDWCLQNWEILARPQGASFRCVVIRRNGQVVLLWPFVVNRKKGLWREARPLGALLTEYSEPLQVEDARVPDRIARALAALSGHADLILLPLVPEASPLGRILSQESSYQRLFTLATHRMEFAPDTRWQDVRDSLPADFRRDLARRRRRLREFGVLQFDLCVEPSRAAPVMDWILERKRRWLASTGKSSPWLGTESYRRRMMAAAGLPQDPPQFMVSTLTLNGRILAAKGSRVDRSRIEFLISTYEPEFRQYGPSQMLGEELMEWACARGLEADFRIGDEPYKELWTNRHDHCTTFVGPAGAWGRVFLRSKAVASAWRGRIRARSGRVGPVPEPSSADSEA